MRKSNFKWIGLGLVLVIGLLLISAPQLVQTQTVAAQAAPGRVSSVLPMPALTQPSP